MLNPAYLIADALGHELARTYEDMFGERHPEYASIARTAAKLVIERIANSDALYHDSHHTVMVTLVGQAIFKGRILVEALRDDDWLHYTFAPRRARNRYGKHFVSFLPAVSRDAVVRMQREIRSWHLPRRSDKSLQDLARMFNRIVQG